MLNVNKDFKAELGKYFPSEAQEIWKKFDWAKVSLFLEFLHEKNEIGGFFSKADSLLIWERHVLESIYHVFRISQVVSVSRETTILDVGSGPGLPGFLFTCLSIPPQVNLLDSGRKRLGLLESFCKENFSLYPKFSFLRVEEFSGQFDLVIMRSTIPYPWSIEMISHLVKPSGLFIPFLAKPSQHPDLEEILLDRFAFSLSSSLHLDALNFLGSRHVKFLKKIRKVSDSLKRDWSTIQKEIRKVNG